MGNRIFQLCLLTICIGYAPSIIAQDTKPMMEKLKWHKKPSEAMAVAKKTGRPVFMLFTGKGWCPYCVKLEKTVLSKKKFADWAKKHKLVLLELDFPNRPKKISAEQLAIQKKLQDKYEIRGYPTIVMLDSQGKVLGKHGYLPKLERWWKVADELVAKAKK